ncbi:spore germination protein PA [Halobacillus karajensis]|uniref:Spore germination protein GerPA n=1 Tax=Halobacillus karajensis TaxID=195088 RepID=A0A024P821_9BACI|nr:spore germination protein [Halobacillus karajensis]CDQ21070.1 putative spore germination protein GerPA [Halobacillus karajensis]CDQ24866.1 putative spore germination protein GerPA [Halobacillus karajensis]CDQ28774.1 putative spore germination protein GerPA [Halobacillus karajensis]SEH96590.1 spore germination protein PA [Halobacillus karajensis]
MPAKVGAVKVLTLSSSSIFNIGDVYNMSPHASAKTFAGGGSFNTGDGIRVRLNRANTFINDSEVFDQSVVNND